MPELPEVETMVRGIRSVMEQSVITRFLQCPCDCQPLPISPAFEEFSKRIQGRQIEKVWRRAKRIVIELASSRSNPTEFIVFEPRMTGLALVADPPDVEHLRFEFQLKSASGKSSVFFWDRRGLGTLSLLTEQEFAERLGPNQLGPDALEISSNELFQRLRQTSRQVKVSLLDQKLVAGVGNLYASEILHEAGVHPETISQKISRPRVERIHTAMHRILNEAILYEGSTLNDGTYRNALNKDGSYQNKHRVYAKTGEPCQTCGLVPITRIVQAQRATFFCRKCQRK